jgi:copper(I)-binding protein
MVVSDAYARSTGPSAPTGAAFMHITNDTGQDDVITGVMSDAAAKVELHTHIADGDGVMRMVHVEEGFPIAAGETILLERGGKHVMFMGLNAPMENGAEIEVTFTFETASPLTVTIPVDLDRMPEGHSMSGHGSMGEGHNN